MINRETYTKIFLNQMDRATDPVNVKLHMYRWWKSHRSKDSGGLRLTEEGFEEITQVLKLTHYEIPFQEKVDLNPQLLVFFDKYIDCPYYLTNKSITVFSEKKSFELYVFASDIYKYGLMKAMKNQTYQK